MGVAAIFIARRFGANDRLYKSRITGREYLFTNEGDFIRVYCLGRCVYGGTSSENAFKLVELEDCAA